MRLIFDHNCRESLVLTQPAHDLGPIWAPCGNCWAIWGPDSPDGSLMGPIWAIWAMWAPDSPHWTRIFPTYDLCLICASFCYETNFDNSSFVEIALVRDPMKELLGYVCPYSPYGSHEGPIWAIWAIIALIPHFLPTFCPDNILYYICGS